MAFQPCATCQSLPTVHSVLWFIVGPKSSHDILPFKIHTPNMSGYCTVSYSGRAHTHTRYSVFIIFIIFNIMMLHFPHQTKNWHPISDGKIHFIPHPISSGLKKTCQKLIHQFYTKKHSNLKRRDIRDNYPQCPPIWVSWFITPIIVGFMDLWWRLICRISDRKPTN